MPKAVVKLCYTTTYEPRGRSFSLESTEAELKKLGVERLYLFGSTARGEARDDSDVDLFSITHVAGSVFTS